MQKVTLCSLIIRFCGLRYVPSIITYQWSVRHGGCLRDRRRSQSPRGGGRLRLYIINVRLAFWTQIFSHTKFAPSVSREIVGEALLGMWHVERIAPRGSQRNIVGVIGERKQERDAVDPHIALLLVVPASPRGPGAHVGSSTAAIHGRAVDGPRPAASGKRASEAGGRDAWTRRRCARKTSLCLREVASIENSRRRSDSNMTWV